MAKIKNWTVISQRVKDRQDGLVTYSKYLLDEKHKNHSKNETRIVPLHGNVNTFVKNSICETLDFEKKKKKIIELMSFDDTTYDLLSHNAKINNQIFHKDMICVKWLELVV